MAQIDPKLNPMAHVATRVLVGALYLLLTPSLVLRSQVPANAPQQMQPDLQSRPLASDQVTANAPPIPAPEGVADLMLAPGSLIDVKIFEEPDLNGSYRLDNQGQISIPLAGTIHLQSLTLSEAAAAIKAKLESAQVLKAPHVAVNIDEYSTQKIVVLGAVAAPGRFSVMGQRKLMDVLAMAGGETTLAGGEIVIHRSQNPPDVTDTVHYNHDTTDAAVLNVEINPGDTVLVKKAGIVYVLGSVFRPGGYPMQEAGQLNIDQALALAEGTLPEAKVKKILIIRKQPNGSLVTMVVDYKMLNSGESYPLQLKPQDIVYVPLSHWKYSLLHATQVAAGVATAAIYRVP